MSLFPSLQNLSVFFLLLTNLFADRSLIFCHWREKIRGKKETPTDPRTYNIPFWNAFKRDNFRRKFSGRKRFREIVRKSIEHKLHYSSEEGFASLLFTRPPLYVPMLRPQCQQRLHYSLVSLSAASTVGVPAANTVCIFPCFHGAATVAAATERKIGLSVLIKSTEWLYAPLHRVSEGGGEPRERGGGCESDAERRLHRRSGRKAEGKMGAS